MTLLETLNSSDGLLLDGGMGTQLEAAGITPGGGVNLSHPDGVQGVHQRYVAAGAGALITNTLTLNRIHGGGPDVNLDAANRAGARLARSAAGATVFVLGDISATGQMLEPYGDYTELQFEEAYAEQALSLAEAGVNGFMLETFYDLREALCALRGCRRAAPTLPILASMTFQSAERGGRTMMGNSAADCARALAEAGADAIGANCGEITPQQMAIVIGHMRDVTRLPLIAQPNAGLPTLQGDKAVFTMTPEAFATGVAACRAAGATLLGGCCGTTPAHIAAVARERRRPTA